MSVREVSVGEMSVWGIARSENCSPGNCPPGNCPSRKCLRGGKVRRGNVRWGTVRIPFENLFPQQKVGCGRHYACTSDLRNIWKVSQNYEKPSVMRGSSSTNSGRSQNQQIIDNFLNIQKIILSNKRNMFVIKLHHHHHQQQQQQQQQ